MVKSKIPNKPKGNLDTEVPLSVLMQDWDTFSAYHVVAESDFSPNEKEKLFTSFVSNYYRAVRQGVPGLDDFSEYCETQLDAAVMYDISSGEFSPHQVLKELKFINKASLDKDNKISRLVLRLAHHEPQKTCETIEEFRHLLQKFEDSPYDDAGDLFLEIRKNIDFFGSEIGLEKLQELQNHYENLAFDLGGEYEQDLKIDRQHDETLWYLQTAGMNREDLNSFARVVYALEPFYRNRPRKYEQATHVTDETDAGFNHLLRCVDIDMGIWLEAEEKNIKPYFSSLPAGVSESSKILLEESLTVLLHDALEDAKSSKGPITDLHGNIMDETVLRSLLNKAGIDAEMQKRLIQRSRLLDKKTAYKEAGETEPPKTYREYLERIFNSGDEFAMRSKVADFFQNSQTDLAKNLDEWSDGLKDKCLAWKAIFDSRTELLEFLSKTISPIVVLRWHQFVYSQRTAQVVSAVEEDKRWIAEFQYLVQWRQEASSVILKSDLAV